MNAVRIIGIILIILGVVGLIYGGITYTTHKDVVDLGSLKLQAEEKKSIALPPIISGAVLALGIILVMARRRRSSSEPDN